MLVLILRQLGFAAECNTPDDIFNQAGANPLDAAGKAALAQTQPPPQVPAGG